MDLMQSIGNTPLVELKHLNGHRGIRILAKLEGNNPGGSVKDRTALFMIRAAEHSGELTRDKIVLEPTSGNTGIGIAMVCAARGYRCKLVMPACVSHERRNVLLAFGADIELTPSQERTDGAIRRAHRIRSDNPDLYYMPNQFANPANPQAHYEMTGPEVLHQTEGVIDAFVAGMGTGGTLMGMARFFAENKASVKVVGVEPPIGHAIQGLKNMQESIVPEIYHESQLSAKVVVQDEEAFEMTRLLATREGLFCGMSSGAAVVGALEVARDLPRGSTVVVLLPDRGDRYLSTSLFRSVCGECPP